MYPPAKYQMLIVVVLATSLFTIIPNTLFSPSPNPCRFYHRTLKVPCPREGPSTHNNFYGQFVLLTLLIRFGQDHRGHARLQQYTTMKTGFCAVVGLLTAGLNTAHSLTYQVINASIPRSDARVRNAATGVVVAACFRSYCGSNLHV